MEQELIEKAMQIAIDEGKKSVSEGGKISPKVGASIIRNGEIIGHSFRGQFGEGDHAEYTLFQKVLNGQDVSGSTLFTTLEPCTVRNKRKSCSDWIIEKEIKHIYVGMLDPNPEIYNKGCRKLETAGIIVDHFPKHLREEIAIDNTNFTKQFKANNNLFGQAIFDYTNNDGRYIIGENEHMFETMWSPCGAHSIYAYDDPETIDSISIADNKKEINEIKDASIYDSTSRHRKIDVGEILILENKNGYFAAIKICDISNKDRGAEVNKMIFEFKILPKKNSDFSKSS